MSHLVVGFLIFQQLLEVLIDDLFICTNKPQRSGVYALRPLCRIPHDQNRSAIARALLLNSAAIRKAQETSRLEVMAVKHFYRLDDMNAVTAAKLLLRSFSDHRIHVYRVHSLAIRMFIKNPSNGSEHMMHRFTKVFAAMRGDKDEFSIAHPIKLRVRIVLSDRVLHRVYNRVAGDINAIGILSLFDEVIRRKLRRREVILADNAHRLTVEFLRVRGIDIICTQASFNVTHWDLQIKAG